MRVRKKKWAPAELVGNPLIIRNIKDCNMNLAQCFTEPGLPLHLEIGCGKGRFICETSLRHPHVNHLAIERDSTIVAAAARRSLENGACNVRFIICDVDALHALLLPGHVSRLYINFCDPWPTKKKRARRRLTHDRYLLMYESLKIPEIFFKTDNRILFEFSIECFSRCGWQMSNVSLDLHNSDFEENVVTEYEEKFSAHGPIYRLEARKI